MQMAIIFLYSFLFVLCSSSTLPSPELHIRYGGQALTALKQLLDFFESDSSHLNLDGVYGLRIAQGQLLALDQILSSPPSSSSEDNHNRHHFTDKNQFIKTLTQQIERIANASLIELANTSATYLHRFALVATQPFMIEYKSRAIKIDLIDESQRDPNFDEEESDACFAELLGSTDDNNRRRSEKCFITDACWQLMTTGHGKDYRLTHQLLWFLVAQTIGCLEHRSSSIPAHKRLKKLEDQFCTNIYQDAESNVRENRNQDLFLEQLLLCSIIGYEQFLRFDWFDVIRRWQHPQYGCFSDESETMEFYPSKTKRHLLVEQEMKNGCLSHKSGLAAGLLATYARALLQ